MEIQRHRKGSERWEVKIKTAPYPKYRRGADRHSKITRRWTYQCCLWRMDSATVTFSAYTGTKLYCLVTEAHVCKRLAQAAPNRTVQASGPQTEQNNGCIGGDLCSWAFRNIVFYFRKQHESSAPKAAVPPVFVVVHFSDVCHRL